MDGMINWHILCKSLSNISKSTQKLTRDVFLVDNKLRISIKEVKMIERFPGQKEGEEIKIVVTKHWIIYVRILREFVLFALVPFVGMFLLTDDATSNIRHVVYAASLVYLSYFFLFVFIKWLDEMLDLIIVTNRRIISIDQVNLFQNTASETNLPLIQDVQGTKKGLVGSLLHFGQLEIQTAAENIVFRIHDVGKPFTTAKAILDARDEFAGRYEVHGHSVVIPHSGTNSLPENTNDTQSANSNTL